MNRNILTFADEQVNDRIKSIKHILKDIKTMIDWHRISKILSKTDYRNINYYGRDCYSPLVMFNILLIQRMYGYSDREMENQMLFNNLYMWFCGLSFDSPTPDHVTIHRWRERFIEFGIFQEVFDDFHSQLLAKGYILKDATIVDASLIRSAARPRNKTIIEVETITEDGVEKQKVAIESETSVDPDAKWTFKNKEWEYGYKDHQAVNSDGIILGVFTTPANVHDGTMLPDIIETIKPPKKSKVYADKAYDSTKNRNILHKNKLKDGLMRKKIKNQPLDKKHIKFNKSISKIRFVVERTYGTLKRMYNLGRSKYIGLNKTHNWCLFGAFVFNLVRARNLPRDRFALI